MDKEIKSIGEILKLYRQFDYKTQERMANFIESSVRSDISKRKKRNFRRRQLNWLKRIRGKKSNPLKELL